MLEYPSTFDVPNTSYNPTSVSIRSWLLWWSIADRLGRAVKHFKSICMHVCYVSKHTIAYTHDQMYCTIGCYESPNDELTVWVLEYKCAPISHWFTSLIYVMEYFLAVTHFKSTAGSEVIFTTSAFTVFNTIEPEDPPVKFRFSRWEHYGFPVSHSKNGQRLVWKSVPTLINWCRVCLWKHFKSPKWVD